MHQCGYCTFKSNRKYNLKIHEQRIHAVQSGFGSVLNSTTHIPIETHNEVIEDYREVVGITNQWKISYEKLQEAYQLLQEHRREDGENSDAIITYLVNVLNANNIRYNLDLAWNKLLKKI